MTFEDLKAHTRTVLLDFLDAEFGEQFRSELAPEIRVDRDPTDPNRINITVAGRFPSLHKIPLVIDEGAIDDDPEDDVPCVGCGRVACSCEQSAEGADEEACA